MNKNQKGFHLWIVPLIIVVLGVIGGTAYYVGKKSNEKKDDSATTVITKSEVKESSESVELKEYKLDNEGLRFSYNPKITKVESKESKYYADSDIYIETLNIVTGDSTVTITAGIDGIGGGAGCVNQDRDKCVVVDTKAGKFLGSPITYRLIKADTAQNCGSGNLPSCQTVPLTTSYLIDTSNSTEEYYPCCGMINANAKNVGKKAGVSGALLINIQPKDSIENANLFKNSDVLESFKIIESMKY